MSQLGGKVRIKRVYEAPERGDGFRVLVDRLWPRGLTREEAAVDLWLKEVGPTTALRRWFHKDAARWPEFRQKYQAELAGNPALDELRALVREHARRGGQGVTLVYGAKTPDRNHALVLREVLLAGPTKKVATKSTKSRLKRPNNPMPGFVRDALVDEGLMAAFERRPAYQRNDYLGWITRAKLPVTKHKRLRHMLDELRGGKRYMNMAWRPRG